MCVCVYVCVCVMLMATGFHLHEAEGRAAHISLLCAETIAAFVQRENGLHYTAV